MAGQFETLGSIKQAVIYRGDLEGITDRHPTLNLNQEVNASCRMFRTKAATNDVMAVMNTTALLPLPVTAALSGAGYWAELPWPADSVSVHGMDVLVGGTWDVVKHGTLGQRRPMPGTGNRGDYRYASDIEAMWCEKALPQGSASPGIIQLFPVPSGGQYILWYLTPWVDLTTDTADVPLQEAWAQWVIWDVAVKCLIRDVGQTPSAQLEKCESERAACWADIKPAVQRVVKAGPIEVQSRYRNRGGYGNGRVVP